MVQIQSSRTQIEIVSEGQGSKGIHSIKSTLKLCGTERKLGNKEQRLTLIPSWEDAIVNINLPIKAL